MNSWDKAVKENEKWREVMTNLDKVTETCVAGFYKFKDIDFDKAKKFGKIAEKAYNLRWRIMGDLQQKIIKDIERNIHED
jgi:hypothetical protein